MTLFLGTCDPFFLGSTKLITLKVQSKNPKNNYVIVSLSSLSSSEQYPINSRPSKTIYLIC